jgi:hypothetical protein
MLAGRVLKFDTVMIELSANRPMDSFASSGSGLALFSSSTSCMIISSLSAISMPAPLVSIRDNDINRDERCPLRLNELQPYSRSRSFSNVCCLKTKLGAGVYPSLTSSACIYCNVGEHQRQDGKSLKTPMNLAFGHASSGFFTTRTYVLTGNT